MKADDEGLAAAVAALRAGRVALVPTDTVYGLAAAFDNAEAVAELFVLKRRPPELSIALLVADMNQAEQLAELTDAERVIADSFWPGALTLVVKRRRGVDPHLGRDDGTIVLRMPDHVFMRALTAAVGPLATTSANISGSPTPEEAFDAAAGLDGEVGVIIDDGTCAAPASTVARVDDVSEIVVLRQGELTHAELKSARQKKESAGK